MTYLSVAKVPASLAGKLEQVAKSWEAASDQTKVDFNKQEGTLYVTFGEQDDHESLKKHLSDKMPEGLDSEITVAQQSFQAYLRRRNQNQQGSTAFSNQPMNQNPQYGPQAVQQM